MINRSATIGEVIAFMPDVVSYFKDNKIDYYTTENVQLDTVLKDTGKNVQQVFCDLDNMQQKFTIGNGGLDLRDMNLVDLCEYIMSKYHGYLYKRLPKINEVIAEVVNSDGEKYPELFKISKMFGMFRGSLEQHLLHEEIVLFPAIRSGNESRIAKNLTPEMINDHYESAKMLEDIRNHSGQFTPPQDASSQYMELDEMLAELEDNMYGHIYLENYMLLKMLDVDGEQTKERA